MTEASYADLETAGGTAQLRFTRTFHHPPEKVWRALTEPEHIREWFPSDIEGERAAGAPLRFVFRENEGPVIEGEMLVWDPPSVLEMRWGDDLLRFELEPDGPDGTGTRMTFVNTFPEIGKAARDAAGWHSCLAALDADLDGRAEASNLRSGWKEAHDVYVERFPAEAATIGPPAGAPG
jgi:uncharacterized protein YndB with AHSA1/START domain